MWAKKLLVVLALLATAAVPTVSFASTGTNWLEKANEGGLNTIGEQAYDTTNAPRSVQQIIASIIKVILGFLGIIFVVLLIIGGFRYMTSGGSEEKVQEAVKQIRNAVIGLVIIICAYAITRFITEYVIPKING